MSSCFAHGNAVLCVCRLHGLAGRHAPDQRKKKRNQALEERLEQLRTSDLQALEEQKQACEEQIRDEDRQRCGVSSVISAAGRMPFRT